MKKKDRAKTIVTPVTDTMLDSLEYKRNPRRPFDLKWINEQLEKIDPSGKKAMEEARKMMDK